MGGGGGEASNLKGLPVLLLEKATAAHSSVLAWRILGTAEPGGLPSMGLHRVGHDWRDSAAAAGVLLLGSCGEKWVRWAKGTRSGLQAAAHQPGGSTSSWVERIQTRQTPPRPPAPALSGAWPPPRPPLCSLLTLTPVGLAHCPL